MACFPLSFPARGGFLLKDQSFRRSEGVQRVEERPLSLLNQVHGSQGLRVTKESIFSSRPVADFQWTNELDLALGIFVADCSGIFFCGPSRNKGKSSVLVAVHAGWRGTQKNILGSAVERSGIQPSRASAWLSPAIGPQVYEVGTEVKEAFSSSAAVFFREAEREGHYYFNLKAFQECQLREMGFDRIWSHPLCTFSQSDFFSYRRDQGPQRHLVYAYLPN